MLHGFVSQEIDSEVKCNFTFVNIPHRIYIYTGILIHFMIMPKLIINTYVSLAFEIKKCKFI
jgi:hypothetical protein